MLALLAPQQVLALLSVLVDVAEDVVPVGGGAAGRVREESEYCAAIIDCWSWNDAAGSKSVALEIPSDFCGLVAEHILDYLQNDTTYWEFHSTIGALDAAHYLIMNRLSENSSVHTILHGVKRCSVSML